MKITRQRVFPSIKSWYIFPKMVIRFIIFFHYLGLKFIFQDFFKVPRILQNWVRIPWFRPSKTYWSFRVWWELYVLPPSYIYDYYTQLLGAAQRVEWALGWESRGWEAAAASTSTLLGGSWSCPLSELSFPYFQIKGPGLGDWPSSGSCHLWVIHLHAHPTHLISSLGCS